MIDTTAPVQGSENTYINIHYIEIKSKFINMPSFVWESTIIQSAIFFLCQHFTVVIFSSTVCA